MSTITKEFTKEQLQQIEAAAKEVMWPVVWSEKKAREHFSEKITPKVVLELARIALASLEAEKIAEPVAFINGAWTLVYYRPPKELGLKIGDKLYTAPPTPVVPEEMPKGLAGQIVSLLAHNIGDKFLAQKIWNACRAAMLQGAENELQRKAEIHDALCEKYNVESLADFVDWQRNHIAELEAAPPAPVGPGETAVMPDYPGYAMTQRECYQAGKKAGLSEAGNSPVIPDGWVAVPVEPTEDMIVNGFESEPDKSFSDEKEWEAYNAMSGCRQAAHRAKLCWAAMIAAAPKPNVR